MAKMDYLTPGITKIEFEDSLFVTTGLDGDEKKEVKEFIESRGGLIKNTVTKTIDYLIYKDGDEETAKYNKALELIRDKGLEIRVLPLSLFPEAGIAEGVMEFGSYPFEADGTRKPVWWIVLKKENGKALLLSMYGLDAKQYNEEWEAVTWETCTLRKWLNEDFYNESFTEEEKKRICQTAVVNKDNPWYRTPGGNDTEDRVFLLSFGEAERYLPKTFPRQRKTTPFAKECGASTYDGGNCWWWLRSPGSGPHLAAYVSYDGYIIDHGTDVNCSIYAVSPALWIDLGSDI